MNTFANQIVPFFASLEINVPLPKGVSVLNPYKDPNVLALAGAFSQRYYSDTMPRIPVMGINPGRFGGGLTGISFTDPVNLERACGILNHQEKRPELSSTFVFQVIQQYGPVKDFFQRFFLTAICPLGFMKDGKNFNYYDDRTLTDAIRPFIRDTLIKQHTICGNPDDCICLGEGKNLRFMQEINAELGLFKQLHPLPHPRFIMQYRRKLMPEYISIYLNTLKKLLY